MSQKVSTKPNKFSAKKIDTYSNHATAVIDVWKFDTRQYVYVSNPVKFVAGYNPEDLLKGGVDFTVAKMHPDDREAAVRKNIAARNKVEYFKPGIDDSKPFVSFEYRVQHKNGHWVWLHSDASVYSRTPDGKIEYIISTTVNIDEQKALEMKLQETSKSLEVSHLRLRKDHEQLLALNIAKDEFVSITSHQLRTPATVVKQYLGMMLHGYFGEFTDEQRKILESTYNSNERQLHIIKDLLHIAQIDAGKVKLFKTDFDLIKLIDDIVEEYQEKYNLRQQTLIFRHPRIQTRVISADEQLLRMVIENLIDNASKYSPDSSPVEVRLSYILKNVEITVTDQGCGISKKNQAKLFRKFSRIVNTKSSNVRGSGLGLYWAKQIIDLHKGKIGVKSSTSSGTTFYFSLPIE